MLQDRLALSSSSFQSVRFLSTCVSLVPLALGVTCFRLVSPACTCFRLALTCACPFSALTQTAVPHAYATWPPEVIPLLLHHLRYQIEVFIVAAGPAVYQAIRHSSMLAYESRELLPPLRTSSPQEEQSETPLSKSTPTRRVVFTTENAAVCAALSAEPVRVSVEWYMYVAHSSPLQIRSHLTCQFFCRQLRSHLDNQVRRHLAVISTATLGHPHSHLRACSQVATMFAATSTIIFTAPCSKQDPSRG